MIFMEVLQFYIKDFLKCNAKQEINLKNFLSYIKIILILGIMMIKMKNLMI